MRITIEIIGESNTINLNIPAPDYDMLNRSSSKRWVRLTPGQLRKVKRFAGENYIWVVYPDATHHFDSHLDADDGILYWWV